MSVLSVTKCSNYKSSLGAHGNCFRIYLNSSLSFWFLDELGLAQPQGLVLPEPEVKPVVMSVPSVTKHSNKNTIFGSAWKLFQDLP